MASQKQVDALVRRQTYVDRFSAGIGNRIEEKLDARQIRAILTDPDISPAKKRKQLKAFLKNAKNKADKALEKELKALYKANVAWYTATFPGSEKPKGEKATSVINKAMSKPLVANGGYTASQAYTSTWETLGTTQLNAINGVAIGGMTVAEGNTASRNSYTAFKRNLESSVRTATFAVNDTQRDNFYKANDDIVRGVMFTAVLDGRTTDYCKSQDGKIVPLSSDKRPPFHINCRTIAVPVLTNETDKEARETLEFRRQVTAGDGYDKGDNTKKPWKSVRDADELQVKQAPAKGSKSSGSYGDFLASQTNTSYGRDFIRDTMGVKKGNRFIRQVDQGKNPQKTLVAALKLKANTLDEDGLKKRVGR